MLLACFLSEGFEQELPHCRGHPPVDLQAYRGTVGTPADLPFHSLQHIRDLLLFELQHRASRHTEGIGPGYAHPGIQLRQIGADHTLQRDEAALPRERHETRQGSWSLNDARVLRSVLCPVRHHDQRGPQVADVRERVPRADRQGSQECVDLVSVVLLQVRTIGGFQFSQAEHPDPVFFQLRQQLVEEQLVGLLEQAARTAADRLKLLLGRHPVHGWLAAFRRDLPLESGHPDAKEFVQVRTEDGKEAGSLQERRARVLREHEHPPVEGEGTQLHVEQRSRRKLLRDWACGSFQAQNGRPRFK